MTELDAQPVLRLTDLARELVSGLRAEEEGGDALALWVEVSGTSGDAYTYDLYFQAAADADPADWVSPDGDVRVVVPASSIGRLNGAVLDLNRETEGGGMVIRNPNHPPLPPASPSMTTTTADLSGDVAQRILQVLEQQVNPAIAAHGGRADLVAVEDEVAYLRLSGGCAGCGLAAVTLSQGIEVAIRDAIPEVERIVDVTDHAAGTNPYYEAAKK